jgi:sRNA-binding carbon storage regulator CsrA
MQQAAELRTTSSLVIDVRPGESLDVGGSVRVDLLHKSGQLARLRITAPREVKIEKKVTEADAQSVPSMAD